MFTSFYSICYHVEDAYKVVHSFVKFILTVFLSQSFKSYVKLWRHKMSIYLSSKDIKFYSFRRFNLVKWNWHLHFYSTIKWRVRYLNASGKGRITCKSSLSLFTLILVWALLFGLGQRRAEIDNLLPRIRSQGFFWDRH